MTDAAVRRAHYHQNRDAMIVKRKAYEKANPEKVLRWKRNDKGQPEPTRPRPKLCECCGGRWPNLRGLHLDHDHTSGRFRGWLCSNCNTGIGKLGDTVDGLKQAIEYLNRS